MKGNKTEEETTMKDTKEFLELNDKDLEQVSGGAQVGEILCNSRNKGTSACSSICKGNLSQCVGCSRNHD